MIASLELKKSEIKLEDNIDLNALMKDIKEKCKINLNENADLDELFNVQLDTEKSEIVPIYDIYTSISKKLNEKPKDDHNQRKLKNYTEMKDKTLTKQLNPKKQKYYNNPDINEEIPDYLNPINKESSKEIKSTKRSNKEVNNSDGRYYHNLMNSDDVKNIKEFRPDIQKKDQKIDDLKKKIVELKKENKQKDDVISKSVHISYNLSNDMNKNKIDDLEKKISELQAIIQQKDHDISKSPEIIQNNSNYMNKNINQNINNININSQANAQSNKIYTIINYDQSGAKNGYAIVEFPNAGLCVGNMETNLVNEVKKISCFDGGLDESEWANQRIHGKGKFNYSDNSYYDGEFYFKKVKNGSGTMKYPDGRKFTGNFLDGKEGSGSMKYPDGRIVRGEFIDGVFKKDADT